MSKILKISTVFFVALTAIFATSCDKKLDNQIVINTHINISILPNTLEYQDLNTVGGFMYLTGEGDSYGIIVYRSQPDEFMAYDRKPVILNSSCPNNRLKVEGFYMVDECNDLKYLILNGYNINGDNTHPYWYQTSFDGTTLRIHN